MEDARARSKEQDTNTAKAGVTARSMGETAIVTASGRRPSSSDPKLARQGSRDLLGKGHKKWWVRQSNSSVSLGSCGKRQVSSMNSASELGAIDEFARQVTSGSSASANGSAGEGYSATAADLAIEECARQVTVGSSTSAAGLADGDYAGVPEPKKASEAVKGRTARAAGKSSGASRQRKPDRSESKLAKPDRSESKDQPAPEPTKGSVHSLLIKAGSDADQEQEADARSQSPMLAKPDSREKCDQAAMEPTEGSVHPPGIRNGSNSLSIQTGSDADQEPKVLYMGMKQYTQTRSPELVTRQTSSSHEPQAAIVGRIRSL